MRKLISIFVASSLITACTISALAADKLKNEPDVFVDNSKIIFEDQNAVITDGITLVPARGVFSAMGCKVDWDEETRTVKVTSSTGVRYVVITIDSDTMKICTYKDIMNRVDVDYKLEVPAQIINDRTMIPLRAVSEAFESTVNWNEEKYAVEITTGADILTEDAPPKVTPEPTVTQKPVYDDDGNEIGTETVIEDKRPSMSISTDKTGALEVGEEFTVYIDVDNFIDNAAYLNGVVASFEYDKNKFEYVSGSGTMLGDDDVPYVASEFIENTEFELGTKVVYVTIDENGARTTPGHVYKATFKSLTGEKGTISLNNDFLGVTGYNSYIMFYDGTNNEAPDIEVDGKALNLDNKTITIGK
ncbi:MAG: stalk domain-containing protein [Clostridiales bacterium]|nr:stalk domain-containing protein [Clostridiales bacterium]